MQLPLINFCAAFDRRSGTFQECITLAGRFSVLGPRIFSAGILFGAIFGSPSFLRADETVGARLEIDICRAFLWLGRVFFHVPPAKQIDEPGQA